MNRKALVTILATALAVFSSGCSMLGMGGGSFTEADAGKTFTTAPGETLDIRLKGNYTTGYSWDVADCDMSIVQLASAEYVPSEQRKPGAGGVQHYAFSIVGKGETTLKIVYHRAWERNSPPALTFMLKIVSK